jgi:hypothetical protein
MIDFEDRNAHDTIKTICGVSHIFHIDRLLSYLLGFVRQGDAPGEAACMADAFASPCPIFYERLSS